MDSSVILSDRSSLLIESGNDLESSAFDKELTPSKQKGRKSDGKPLVGPACTVCGEESPEGSTFRRHYGVICCEACKCFFRRTVQMNKRYECKVAGSCPVGKNVRHWCQACRFQKCLTSGMKIDAVKGLGVNKKSGSKDSAKRSPRDDKMSDARSKIVKYDHQAICENLKNDYNLSLSPDPFIHMVDRKNGKEFPGNDILVSSSLSMGYSPINLSLASPIVNLSSPPSVNTLTKRLQASEGTKHEDNAADSCHQRLNRHSVGDIGVGGQSYFSGHPSSYGRSGGGHGSGSYGGHHTNPSTPVGATPSYPASYQSTPCPSACPSPYHHSSANNTPYTTPYQTPAGSPISNHNTPVATPVHSPAASPLPPYASLYSVNPPSLPPYHTDMLINNSRTHRPLPRAYPASCPVSPATSPINLGSRNFDFRHFPSMAGGRNSAGLGHFGHGQLPQIVNFRPSFATANPAGFTSRPPRSAGVKAKPGYELPGFQGPPLSDVVGRLEAHRKEDSPLLGMGMGAESPPAASTKPQSSSTAFSVISAANLGESSQSTIVTSRSASVPEAETEEVLDSLRLRITHMFKWAAGVAGFEFYSPLDQKALMRRTVVELVMLGFAKASIGVEGMLLLGDTGKAIRPTHENPGIAAVVRITLARMVAPLQFLTISGRELKLLKEIVLFNPETEGLSNRDMTRQFRRKRLNELLEHTNSQNTEPSRFGELLCLLTPLYEVSQEVTDQLRLEQFVNEGETRIDALLLMSMIQDAGTSNVDISLETISS